MKKILFIILILFLTGCTDASFRRECGNDDNFLMSISTSYRCINSHTIGFCKLGKYVETKCESKCIDSRCGCDEETYVKTCTEDNTILLTCLAGDIYPDRCTKGCSDGKCNDECPKGTTWKRGEDYKFACIDNGGIDPECSDSTFTSKCVTKYDMLSCDDGKSSTETCEYGCYEGGCRDDNGRTDNEHECIDNSYCESYQICSHEKCIGTKECEVSSDCLDGNECIDNTCQEEEKCKINSDCKDGYECLDNTCQEERECVESSDCDDGFFCIYNECIDKNSCNKNSDCDEGFSCINKKCKEDEICKKDSDCDTGYECTKDGCIELECEDDFDCDDGLCKNNKCVEGCEDNFDCSADEICKDSKCITGCEDDLDCDEDFSCKENKCIKNEGCIDDFDCDINFECKKKECILVPECTKGTMFCGSSTKMLFCEDEKLNSQDCIYGCKENKCMTQEQKETEDKKLEEETSCKDNYGKCLTDNKIEFCSDGKIITDFCKFGCEKDSCLSEKKCPWYNPLCDKDTDSGILEYKDAVSSVYMKGLNNEISKETDPAKLRGLKKYKEFLDKAGGTADKLQTTYKDLMTMKKIFLDSYDPSMDIENMNPRDILKKGFTDRVGDSFEKLKFWKGKKTPVMLEQEKAEDQLAVYKAMLERKEENDFLKTSRKDRLVKTLISKTKDKAVEKLTDKATGIAEDIAGPAFITVGIAKQAIDAVKDESEKMMYTGLVKAYNKRREALERQFPDKDNDELHNMATEQVIEDPYGDDTKFTRLASYGNLVEQRECGESESKLCIDRKVFFTAMDKSYNHLNNKRLFTRNMKQLDKRLNK